MLIAPRDGLDGDVRRYSSCQREMESATVELLGRIYREGLGTVRFRDVADRVASSDGIGVVQLEAERDQWGSGK